MLLLSWGPAHAVLSSHADHTEQPWFQALLQVLVQWDLDAWDRLASWEDPNTQTFCPALAVDSRDAYFVAFYRKTGAGCTAIVSMHLPASLGGAQHYLTPSGGLPAACHCPALALMPDGKPVLGIIDATTDKLKVLGWSGTLGSPPAGSWVLLGGDSPTPANLPSWPSIAVGSKGTAFVAYPDPETGGR